MDMENLPDLLPRIRKMQLNDRAIMDKATRSFVSYIRSYSKHECNVLLRVKGNHLMNRTAARCLDFFFHVSPVNNFFDLLHEINLIARNLRSTLIKFDRFLDLDFGALATGFGLLKLPKMPELKRFKALSFEPYDIDLNDVAYKYAILTLLSVYSVLNAN